MLFSVWRFHIGHFSLTLGLIPIIRWCINIKVLTYNLRKVSMFFEEGKEGGEKGSPIIKEHLLAGTWPHARKRDPGISKDRYLANTGR